MRPVDLQPGDGNRAIEDMRRAGAQFQEQESGEIQEQEAGAGSR